MPHEAVLMTFVTVTDICSPDELPDRVIAVPVLAVAFAADAAFVAVAAAVLPLLPLVPVVSTVYTLQAAVTAAAASTPRTAMTLFCRSFGARVWLLTDLLVVAERVYALSLNPPVRPGPARAHGLRPRPCCPSWGH
jgi:hypothetical protein